MAKVSKKTGGTLWTSDSAYTSPAWTATPRSWPGNGDWGWRSRTSATPPCWTTPPPLPAVREKMAGIDHFWLHAPFAELAPLCRGPAGAGGDGPALSSGFVRRPAAGHPPSGDPQRLYPAGVLSGVVHGAVRGLLAGVPAGGPGGYGAGAGKRHGRDAAADDGHRPSGG